MIMSNDAVHELQLKIANYKRVRETITPSMHAWCDMLIRETEDQLQKLSPASPAEPPADRPSEASPS